MAHKVADIYVIYYKRVLESDKFPEDDYYIDELERLLEHELKRDLELGGYFFEGKDRSFYNLNRDDRYSPKFYGDLYDEKNLRASKQRGLHRPPIVGIQHTNGQKELFAIETYSDLDKLKERLKYKPS